MEVLAIVPARSGSKGLPGKNILPLCGHPLLAYSIAAARQSRLVNRVICSTDSPEFAVVAASYGAETPFLRPPELAQDLSTDLEAFKHALGYLCEKEDYVPDIVVHLRPTSPIRFAGQVDEAIGLLLDHPDCDSVRSVTTPPANPFKMWRKDTNGFLEPLLTVPGLQEPYNSARQLLPEVWWQTGTLDIVRVPTILEKDSVTGCKILGFPVPQEYSVDIDTQASFDSCERIVQGTQCIRPRPIES